MVKPNDEELEALLGIKIENRYQTIDAAKEMLRNTESNMLLYL